MARRKEHDEEMKTARSLVVEEARGCLPCSLLVVAGNKEEEEEKMKEREGVG